ncbi:MAG: hypothetical protein IJ418_12040 [Clostridia bacterium]|nr:hypothetical protein [Clostridia bacterium]
MAFTCQLFLKEECDGCGACMERLPFDEPEEDEDEVFLLDDDDYEPLL